jgi:exopolyphosphatase / guanosine-5'-triphosphate,3'-diphosphate pyrophosphatase
MGRPPVRVGVVDIGTNSMRLLVTDGIVESGRWVEVTGLGRGVDASGRLSQDAMERTLAVLRKFGMQMTALGVEKRYAMATSASRDASNREEFLDLAEQTLGVRPDVITGAREGLLSYDGAEADFLVDGPILVSDIGGGSTELVIYDESMSIQMGSVRLTDRMSSVYPLPDRDYDKAMEMAWSAFSGIDFEFVVTHIGVAGTWTSLAAIVQNLPRYEPSKVHGYWLEILELDRVLDMLCGMTLEEIEAIPSLDPKRAPVIRAGAMVAHAVAGWIGLDATLISVKDSLDGAALELLGLTSD